MPEQLNLLEGLNRRDAGISLVSNNAQEFIAILRRVAIDHSMQHGSVTSDALRVYADRFGIRPHHKNAWGGIFRGANWKCMGRQRSEYPDNHAREIKVWQWMS